MKALTIETQQPEREWSELDVRERNELVQALGEGLQREPSVEMRQVLTHAVDALRGRPHGWLTQDDEARAGVLDGWRMVASAQCRNQRRARVFRAAVRMLEGLHRN
ncbi:MAG: hypothetical protein KGN78_13275 [Actinomycetales bacterium]|nr:hypothetical protein [Actinomycetales bacterium]